MGLFQSWQSCWYRFFWTNHLWLGCASLWRLTIRWVLTQLIPNCHRIIILLWVTKLQTSSCTLTWMSACIWRSIYQKVSDKTEMLIKASRGWVRGITPTLASLLSTRWTLELFSLLKQIIPAWLDWVTLQTLRPGETDPISSNRWKEHQFRAGTQLGWDWNWKLNVVLEAKCVWALKFFWNFKSMNFLFFQEFWSSPHWSLGSEPILRGAFGGMPRSCPFMPPFSFTVLFSTWSSGRCKSHVQRAGLTLWLSIMSRMSLHFFMTL